MDDKPSSEDLEKGKKQRFTLKNIEALIFGQSLAVRFLLILAVLYTLYFTRSLLIPIFLAFLLYFLLIPIINFLNKKLHIPAALGSALVIVVLLIIVGYGFYFLSLESQGWSNKGPDIINALNRRVNALTSLLKTPMEILMIISKDIENSLNLSVNQNAPTNLINILFSNVWTVLIEFCMMLIILYFLLASKNFFLTKIVKILLHVKRQKKADIIMRQIERSFYANFRDRKEEV